MATLTSVFKMRTPFLTLNCLLDIFSENIDYQNQNVDKQFLSYLTLCTEDNSSIVMGLEDMEAIWLY